MPNQNLKTLLAQGKIEQALDVLVRLVQHSDDADLRQRVLTLSGQFAALKKQHLTGLLDDKDYRLQSNRIFAAVAEIADDQQLSESSPPRKMSWEKWALVLGIFAAVAGITGYTLRDIFFQKTDSAPLALPAAEPAKKDTLVLVVPPPGKSVGKSNVNITVKDSAKVGNIITGDSNKIDIKQDF